MIKVYGIPNCDSVKKARQWLTEEGLTYEFHDYKKLGIDAALVTHWLEQAGPDIVINKRGTTWRKLSDNEKTQAETLSGAAALLTQNTSVIKRPVIVAEDTLIVGYDPAQMATLK